VILNFVISEDCLIINFIISKEFVIGQLYHLTVSCFPNFTPEEQKLD